MIEKQEFYHGAAIIQLLEQGHLQKIQQHDIGYIVNDDFFVFLKYSTKSHSPWRFNIGDDEMIRLWNIKENGKNVITVLVCGGDGICALNINELEDITGDNSGWVAVKRKHNEQYSVSGTNKKLKNKISLRRWPLIILQKNKI